MYIKVLIIYIYIYIYDNIDLITIALDGLACASSCRNKIIPGIIPRYVGFNCNIQCLVLFTCLYSTCYLL